MFSIHAVLRDLSVTDAERLARAGVRCSHLGCDAPVVAVRTSKTPTMPAPGFYYLCEKHATAKKGERQ
jgi:hypothetical protein